VARALIALANTPLAAPSANTSGTPSPTKAEHVFRDLCNKVRVILDGGPCRVGVESTVVDGLGSDGFLRVLRPGGVTVEDMERVLAARQVSSRVLVHRRDYQDHTIEYAPTTPGMKYRHYSPSVPVVLLMTTSPTNGEKPRALPDVLSTLISSYSCMQYTHQTWISFSLRFVSSSASYSSSCLRSSRDTVAYVPPRSHCRSFPRSPATL